MTENTGREFIRKTRYAQLGPSDQRLGRPQPPLQWPHDPCAELVPLPRPAQMNVARVDLTEAIERRCSVREYAETPLALAELSYLLWCTQGVRRVVGRQVTFRTVPSAGARHALETFVLANRVGDLPAGLYRFLAIDHMLLPVRREPQLAEQAVAACLGQHFVASAAAALFWAADVYRMSWRYGERGYRYLLLDAGHVCQNLYLAAEAIGCGACAIGAFDDDAVTELLGLDGVNQLPLYAASVGRKPPQ